METMNTDHLDPAWPALHKSHLAQVFAQYPIEIAHGEGVWLHARDGRKILDFYGGHAVAGLGYGHPRWVAALERQARQMAFRPTHCRWRCASGRRRAWSSSRISASIRCSSSIQRRGGQRECAQARVQDHRAQQGRGAGAGLAWQNRRRRRRHLGRSGEVVWLSAHAVRCELRAAQRPARGSSSISIGTPPRSSSSRCRAWAAPTISASRC